ncbi:thiosulfate/3-mercaptopyruvate sulfurtransferase [Rathayibacter sp. PhB93]|uniref:sulfurtransferase n=1 Tax=unclassified Rathayibacter TaxID=2609250 RepID=UPI000F46535E|nr:MULTISPECIES: sulfurtransferase [unclassified Rathayibacter]ROQ05223.1 thiosulfate/3-mercaptopyruvate sulfurtransferase [Rathayibacter sp. PhB93]TDQ12706.1 thiosulfate/3-mercaptopyruvate sulfurtransferase [Rathayibacter sp. PhB1]
MTTTLRSDVLVTPDELEAALASPEPPLVLDVRWRLDRPDGRPAYLEGHLPGAVYVDLDHELAAHGAPEDGRHPLPPIEALQESARRWGLRQGQAVVVYDDLKNLSSARAWWLLRAAGVADVRLLDGSLRAWTGSGRALESGPVSPVVGDVELAYGALPVLDIDEAAALPSTGVLLDARAPERYRGDVEPIDPRAGHIPGALNAPATGNVDADGRFLDAAALRARFESLGVRPDAPVGVYCGSGVTAAADAVALTLAGFAPSLYPGSWSQWSTTADRPVATGPDA